MTRMGMIAALPALALGLAGCRHEMDTGTPVTGGARATAMLVASNGQQVGRATATDVAGGVRFTMQVRAMPPGTHGAHVHTVGQCDAPGFAAAGGHWNPTTRQHGAMNPQGPHLGDLPNLMIGSDGRGTLGAVIPGITVAQMLDADGASMMVHAGPDDLMTDPSGNSGGRIACGVFAAG